MDSLKAFFECRNYEISCIFIPSFFLFKLYEITFNNSYVLNAIS